MQAQLTWLDEPTVYQVNALPPHADHEFYASDDECDTHASSLVQSLDGSWQFSYFDEISHAPLDWYHGRILAAKMTTINVPGPFSCKVLGRLTTLIRIIRGQAKCIAVPLIRWDKTTNKAHLVRHLIIVAACMLVSLMLLAKSP